MRFSFVAVLLDACLSAALPGLPIPRLPDVPDVPRLPDTPEIPNSPGQPGNGPGRWPPEGQNPDIPPPVAPGRMPQPLPQRPNQPSCGGKKRMGCTDWDQLDIPAKFQGPGRAVVQRLDSVKVSPPQPPNAPSMETMVARYHGQGGANFLSEIPWVLRSQRGIDDGNNWYEFKVRNKDETIDRFISREKATAQTQERVAQLNSLANCLRTSENMLEHWTSPDGKTLVFDKFFNEKLDLYRDYDKDPLGETVYERQGLDKDATVRFTDQAMFGWKLAIGNRNPRDVGLENIVHKDIITEETNTVIEASLARAGRRFESSEDVIVFEKGQEEFEAIMGTIHGRRMAEMLTDYHDLVGDRTITRFLIGLSDGADGFSRPQPHDMLIELGRMS